MDEETIRAWAKDEATKVYQNLGTRFGVPQVPVHFHNGNDTPLLPPTSVSNVKTLSAQTGFVLGNRLVSNYPSSVPVFPIPVISSQPTGTGVEGALVGSGGILYLYSGGSWHRINP